MITEQSNTFGIKHTSLLQTTTIANGKFTDVECHRAMTWNNSSPLPPFMSTEITSKLKHITEEPFLKAVES